jgi:uncharacterized protein YbjQ (UPF0145 family)
MRRLILGRAMSVQHGLPDPELDLINTRLARRNRLVGVQAWGSLGQVEDFAATAVAGFDPVGHVFGTVVQHLGYVTSSARCSGDWTYTAKTDQASLNGPYRAMLRTLYGARRLALARAVEECVALGGDGIIGARMTAVPLPAGGVEFSVHGTAVRARSRTRPERPFTTHVSGQELARLLSAGWVPFALLFGIAISSRHDGRETRDQTRRRIGDLGNREVLGYSRLVTDARRDARRQLKDSVGALGGDGLVVSEMSLRVDERECPTQEGQHDHVAEATILGSAIAAFRVRPGARGAYPPLTIMNLGCRKPPETPGDEGSKRSAEPSDEGAAALPEANRVDRASSKRAARARKRDVYSNARNPD